MQLSPLEEACTENLNSFVSFPTCRLPQVMFGLNSYNLDFSGRPFSIEKKEGFADQNETVNVDSVPTRPPIPHICHMHHMQCRCQIFRLVSKSSSNNGNLTSPPFWWWLSGGGGGVTTTQPPPPPLPSKSVVSRFTLFCQLCHNLRVFGVKFLSSKWCWCQNKDKYEVWVLFNILGTGWSGC